MNSQLNFILVIVTLYLTFVTTSVKNVKKS